MTEIWRPIKGYEDRYEISNFGRVKSFAQSNRQGRITEGYIDKKGYHTIYLYDNLQHGKWFKIHRLVAEAFLKNSKDLPQINHKDENKSNNHVDNLEWCDNLYNINYGTKISRTTEKNKCCKTTSCKVYSIDKDGNIEYFDSIGEAERITGCSHSNIVRALKGRTKKCGGKKWYYNNSQIANND